MSTRPQHQTIITLQILRAFAASFVVIEHLAERYVKYSLFPPADRIVGVGWIGVSIFFIISGYIMLVTTYDQFESRRNWSSFILGRLNRIVPLYFLTTIALCFKIYFVDHISTTWRELFYSALFIPYVNPSGIIQPVYGLGWSLNFEMYFYVILASTLFFRRTYGVLLCMTVIASVCLLQLVIEDSPTALRFYGNYIALYFVIGMLIGLLRKTASNTSNWPLFVSVVVASLGAILAAVSPVMIVSGLCGSVAVYAASRERRSAPANWLTHILKRAGDSSYSVYLTHSFVLGPLFAIAHRYVPATGVTVALVFLVAIVVTNLIGYVVYRTVERPLLSLTHRRPVGLQASVSRA